jgi:hypothetical protein
MNIAYILYFSLKVDVMLKMYKKIFIYKYINNNIYL